jgi:hypothetical protein
LVIRISPKNVDVEDVLGLADRALLGGTGRADDREAGVHERRSGCLPDARRGSRDECN